MKLTGLFFHIIGEGVVRITNKGRVASTDKENYIDFRMRLLGESSSKSGKYFIEIKRNNSKIVEYEYIKSCLWLVFLKYLFESNVGVKEVFICIN